MASQVRQRLRPQLWDHCYFQTAPARETFDALSFLFDEPIRILDVGCGEKVYAGLFSKAQYVGFDYTAEKRNVDLVADATRIPFPDSSFDLVICSEVLEHVYRSDLAIAELKRVTKPGGWLYLSTPFLFPIHNARYDFYRYTHLFYAEAFRGSEFLAFRDANVAWSIPLVLVNRVLHQLVRSDWMRPLYLLVNLGILAIEGLARLLTRALGRRPGLEFRLRSMPAGYSMVIRLAK
jgi:SAM-dependent methyltransferase